MLISVATQRQMLRTLGGGALVRVSGASIPAIFDNEYVPVSMGGEFQQADASPAVTVTTADAKRLKLVQGAKLDVISDGVTTPYLVREPQPDGTGMTILILDASA